MLYNNPSTGCRELDIPAPQIEGSITPISSVELSSESVDLCKLGWEKHLRRDCGLTIKPIKEVDKTDISLVDKVGNFSVGQTLTLTKNSKYALPKQKKLCFEIENRTVLDKMAEMGQDVIVTITSIISDPMIGHAVVLRVI